jgi:hypothetical protein
MGVLDGMRIVEVSAFIAAPLRELTLAQLGWPLSNSAIPWSTPSY